jgi:endonuclease YncB( thermonuclease family)
MSQEETELTPPVLVPRPPRHRPAHPSTPALCPPPNSPNGSGVGPVAQWLEPAAHNRLVGGSSPSGPTRSLLVARQVWTVATVFGPVSSYGRRNRRWSIKNSLPMPRGRHAGGLIRSGRCRCGRIRFGRDGDILSIADQIIRLHGIDAPEAGQRCLSNSGESWNCRDVAMDRLMELAAKKVTCTGSERDDRDRHLAVCRTSAGVDVNRILVREGLAWAFLKFSHDYVADEEAAREDGVGVWQAATQPSWDYRAERWSQPKWLRKAARSRGTSPGAAGSTILCGVLVTAAPG